MGANIAEKLIKEHLVDGIIKPGNEISIKIDQTLTQDATGTMAYLEFEAMGVLKVKTELSVSYVDHNTLQDGFENADDHKYLQTVANKYGILHSKAGNGICHQVHLERFAKPGKTLLGSDSHTPTAGGICSLAIGAGGLDVVAAMAGQPFFLSSPKVIRINLDGKLKPFVNAKDVILEVLRLLTTKGNVSYIVEYGGDGVKSLSVPERATITNMGAELGVTTSIFPSDEVTKEFLSAQKRGEDWKKIEADKDAQYEKVMGIDLSLLEPMVAKPHSPDNVCKVKEVEGTIVNQVCVGSCTNSSYRDLMMVANILKGKKIHKDVSLIIAPGSKQVLKMLAKNGMLSELISAGARIVESACGFCIGAGQAPITDAVSVRTTNRNFMSRSGTKSAKVFLVSPETAAACALNGKIADPREIGIEEIHIKSPEQFLIDDSMILKPGGGGEVYRGPNISEPPKSEELRNIKGVAGIKLGDKITTDHIMPAGPRLKYRSNIPKYAEFVFENVDKDFSGKALKNKKKGIDTLIVAGLSYGQGSSREHAAICPMHLGVKAVVAKSIERIHKANLINFGILPLEFVDENDYDKIDVENALEIDNIIECLNDNNKLILKNKNKKINLKYNLSQRQKNILLAGGYLNYIKNES